MIEYAESGTVPTATCSARLDWMTAMASKTSSAFDPCL